MASSDIARAESPDPGSTGPRFSDLLRSFSGQARLALGTRGVLWASAAGVVGLVSCLIAFADIGLSLHRSDVDPERRKAREVAAVDNGVRLLMRGIYGASSAARPGGDPTRVVEEPWRNFVNSLELLCRDFALPQETKLFRRDLRRPACLRRAHRTRDLALQTGRDETDIGPRRSCASCSTCATTSAPSSTWPPPPPPTP